MGDPKPMDPARLAVARTLITTWDSVPAELRGDADGVARVGCLLSELIADRDHQAARAAKADEVIKKTGEALQRQAARADAAERERDGERAARLEALRDLTASERDLVDARRRAAEAEHYLVDEQQMSRAALSDLGAVKARLAMAERERDEARAAVTRLRARVRVEAADVEQAGVTDAKAKRHLLNLGWTLGRRFRGGVNLVHLCENGETVGALRDMDDEVFGEGYAIAFICGWIAKRTGRLDWDILDEMAAMEVPK